jgi:predicted nucleotidyltransferase
VTFNLEYQKILDHYYFELTDGSIGVVTGNMHFQSGLIGYVKYKPTSHLTPWSRNGVFYERLVKNYTAKEVYEHTEWRIYTPFFDVSVPFIPLSTVKRVYCPITRAKELYSRVRDSLEKLALDFIDSVSTNTSVIVGVSGSLLPGIHNAELSDIDTVVYGVREALRVLEFIDSNKDSFKPFSDSRLRAWSVNLAKTTGLTPREVVKYYRNWRRGVFLGREYSVIYNDGVYREITLLPSFKSLGVINLEVELCGGVEALNYPSTGRVLRYRFAGTPSMSIPYDVTSIVSYEALYTTGLYEGGVFEVNGLLQCSDVLGECRVLLGVLEHQGFMRYLGQ